MSNELLVFVLAPLFGGLMGGLASLVYWYAKVEFGKAILLALVMFISISIGIFLGAFIASRIL